MFTLPYIVGLAAADAVNPCALAILLLVLVAILTRYPRERSKVLKIGFAFTITVLVVYFLYGLVFINVFKGLSALNTIKPYLYIGLGILALVLGGFNVKDFFKYGAGGMVTEIPRKWRPRMRGFISGITSVWGAMIMAIIISLFLLPCTIGPYIIASGLLAELAFIKTLPWLLLYNIIFILPMIVITLIVYFGFRTVDQMYGWRESKIKVMHLIAGLIMLAIGILLVTGILH